MKLQYNAKGNLIPGIYILSMEEFEEVFGYNEYRKLLIKGIKKGIEHLKNCGCTTIYVDGSFVTRKEIPGDFDICWEHEGMDIEKLQNEYKTLVTFDNERELQKKEYQGEFFPARINASPFDIYFNFFQKDKDGNPKGMVQINI
jgi:hypothetical protein